VIAGAGFFPEILQTMGSGRGGLAGRAGGVGWAGRSGWGFQTKATLSFRFIYRFSFFVLVLVLFPLSSFIALLLLFLSPLNDVAEGERERENDR
jgi:hypothetical protein